MAHSKGFTLIELLVVISIIAVLLSILMPALNKAKDKAKSVVCKSNLKHFGLIFTMYADDNNGKFMRGWLEGPATNWGDGMGWIHVLRPYYSGVGNFRLCPKTPKPKPKSTEPWWWGGVLKAWGDYSGTAESGIMKGDYGSYGMNDWAHNPPQGPVLWGGTKYSDFWLGPYNVPKANNVPLFYDCIWTGSMPSHTNAPPEEEGLMIWTLHEQMNRNCIRRHDKKGINILFMDQHVELVSLKRHWKLKWYKGFDTKGYWATPGAPWPDWMRGLPE